MDRTDKNLVRLAVPLAVLVLLGTPSENRAGESARSDTLTGILTFATLDGSAQDGDGLSDGTWTLPGDLRLDGNLACGRFDAQRDSGCPVSLRVEGDLVLLPGSSVASSGGLILDVAGDLWIRDGAIVTAEGAIDIKVGGAVGIDGLVSSHAEPSATGENPASIRVTSTAAEGLGVRVGPAGTVAALDQAGIGSWIELTGCGIEIQGSLAVVERGPPSEDRAGASVVVRSCDGLLVDGRGFHQSNEVRRGQLEIHGAGDSVIELEAPGAVILDDSQVRVTGGEGNRIEVISKQGTVSWRRGLGSVDQAGWIRLTACDGVDLLGSGMTPNAELVSACGDRRELDQAPDLGLRTAGLLRATAIQAPASLGAPCIPGLEVDNMVIATDEEFVSCDVLKSEATRIVPPGVVTYRARQSIELESGFSVEGTSIFIAILDSTINQPPVINSDGGGPTAAIEATENQTLVTDVNSTDPDGDMEGAGLAYSITGGADEGFFSIDSVSGTLSFHLSRDFEVQADDDANGVYEVQVTVTDSGNACDVQDISVTITDVNEAPQLVTGALNFIEAESQSLYTATSVAVSPDGRNVYATGRHNHTVVALLRDPATGTLDYLEAEVDGLGGVDGLRGAISVAVSSDGRHVYVAGFDDNAIAVFSRSATTGELEFVESRTDSVRGPRLATSPDGRFVYAVNFNAHSLVSFKRDYASGGLTFNQVVRYVDPGVQGLVFPSSVAVSADGRHLYVTSRYENSVAVFARDSATGDLSFVSAQFDGVNGVDGLDNASWVTVSPDGGQVYVTALGDRSIAVFSRSAVDGTLSFVEVHKDQVNGIDGLDGAISVAVSPDGHHVYVASFYENTITTFSRDVDGRLELNRSQIGGGDTSSLKGASAVAVSPDGLHVYAASALGDAVVALERKATNGMFLVGSGNVLVVEITNDLRVLDVDDSYLLSSRATISNPIDQPYEVLSADTSGTAISASYEASTGVLWLTGSDTLANYEQALRTLTYGNSAFAPDPATRRVTLVVNDGALTSNELSVSIAFRFPPTITSNGGGPAALVDAPESQTAVTDFEATDPDGDVEGAGLTYSITGGADSRAFSIGSSNGALRFLTAPDFDNPTDSDGFNDYEVQVTVTDTDGLRDFQDLSVTVIDLSNQPTIVSNGGGPTAVVVVDEHQLAVTDVEARDPDGDTEGAGLVYSLLDNADRAQFSISEGTGLLTLISPADFEAPGDADADNDYEVQVAVTDSDGLMDVQDITVSVADANEPPSLTATRLSFVEAEFEGVNGVQGLDGASSVALSPDGRYAYVAGRESDSIAVFLRDPLSGEFSFVEAETDGVGGVEGLAGVRSIALSADGLHLYSAAALDDTVAIFERSPVDGGLTYLGVVTDGLGGVEGLDEAYSVAVSSDGLHVYAVGRTDSALAVFSRDSTTGMLTFVESQRHNVNGVLHLSGPESVALSPDGRHVYTANFYSDSIVAFSRDAISGGLSFVGYELQGLDGVSGLHWATAVTVSPDGLHLYVGSITTTVAVFARDPVSGELSFVNFEDIGKPGLSVAPSRSGRSLYLVGFSAVSAFSRDPASGVATYLEGLIDGIGGVDGLGGATGVAVTRDDRYVCTAAASDDALAVFSRVQTGATFWKGGGPVSILAADLGFTIVDIDDVNLTSSTVFIENLVDAPHEVLAVDTTGTAIAASYSPALGVLALTGSDTVANYQQVLRTLTYDNTMVTDTTSRVVVVTANDGSHDSNTFTVTVTTSDPP